MVSLGWVRSCSSLGNRLDISGGRRRVRRRGWPRPGQRANAFETRFDKIIANDFGVVPTERTDADLRPGPAQRRLDSASLGVRLGRARRRPLRGAGP